MLVYLWKQGPYHRWLPIQLPTTGTSVNIKYLRLSLTPIKGTITVCNLIRYVIIIIDRHYDTRQIESVNPYNTEFQTILSTF